MKCDDVLKFRQRSAARQHPISNIVMFSRHWNVGPPLLPKIADCARSDPLFWDEMSPAFQLVMFERKTQQKPCSALLTKSWTVKLSRTRTRKNFFGTIFFCAGSESMTKFDTVDAAFYQRRSEANELLFRHDDPACMYPSGGGQQRGACS